MPASPGRPGAAAVGSGASTGSGSAACSRMTCALVPLTPKAETPARRGRSAWGQGRCSVTSATPPADQSTFGVGWSTCRVRGNSPWRSASTILSTPAMPAADWVWPMLDLIEPSHSGCSAVCSRP